MLGWLDWLEAIRLSTPLLGGAIAFTLLTFVFGKIESMRLLNNYRQNNGQVAEQPMPTLIQYMRVLPYLILSFSHHWLQRLQKFLTYTFFLSLAAAFTLPWTFDALAAKVYALNGVSNLYANGNIRPQILAFQQDFIPISLALVASLIVWMLGINMAPRIKFRWLIAILGFIAFMASLGFGLQIVLPFLWENMPTLLGASTLAGNLFSVLSQFILAPIYALFLGSVLSIALVPLSVFTFLGGAIWAKLIRRKGDETPPFIKTVSGLIYKGIFTAGLWVGAGAAISFALTITALMVGEMTMQGVGIQRLVVTRQLLFVNAFADGLTLALTVWTIGFGASLSKKALIKFLVSTGEKTPKNTRVKEWLQSINGYYVFLVTGVIFADLLFAAMFAVASLYFGLLGGQWQVSIAEAFHILFGLNQSGSAIQMNEQFWIMHTTFLPTFLYMCFVFVALLLMLFWNKYLAGALEKAPKPVRKVLLFAFRFCAVPLVMAIGPMYIPEISQEQYVNFVREDILRPTLSVLHFFSLS